MKSVSYAIHFAHSISLRSLSVCVLAFLLSNCALMDATDSSSDARDDASDAQDDASDARDDASESPTPDSQSEAFADCVDLEGVIDIDPVGSSPRFQPRVAYDGNTIWSVYTRKNAQFQNQRDVMVARFTCAEGITKSLIKVNQHPILVSAPTPSIDIKGDTAHIVWNTQIDEPGGSRSVVAYRAYDLSGTPKGVEESIVKFSLSDESTSVGFYDADIVAMPNGDAIIAATRDLAAQDTTQVFLQRIGPNGIVIDRAAAVPFGPSSLQQRQPSIALDATGRAWIAWLAFVGPTGETAENYVTYASFDAETLRPDAVSALDAAPLTGPGPSLSKDMRAEQSVYLGYQTSAYNMKLLNVAKAATPSAIGVPEPHSFHPSVAATGDRGAIAWYSQVGPTTVEYRTLNIQSFRDSASGLKLGEHREVAVLESIAASNLAGAPAVIALGGGAYFMVYQEGPFVEATTLRARFIKLAPPAE